MASRRLAIIDLSEAGHMPMVSQNGDLVITFNGEIYNYVELRAELRAKGYSFRSSTDTEVLLAAYEAWGTKCLDHLNGMFAFAIWDEIRQILFAARDRFGEKPFYYFEDTGDGLFLFASEIKALFASGLVRPEPNQKSIFRYLAHSELDVGGATLFEGVSELPPAHALIYSRAENSLKTWRYWDLDPEAEVRMASDQAYAEKMLELLSDSVRMRLRSDVQLGSSLSGGLDSSTLVCLLARELGGNPPKTFSARFADARYDEGRHISRIIEWTGVQNHSVYPDPRRLPEEIECVTWHQDLPFLSTSVYAQWNVMRLALQEGVTVLLDGQGADETLAGYHPYFGSYYRELLRKLRWLELWNSILSYVGEHGSRALPVILYYFLPIKIGSIFKRLMKPSGISTEFAREWGTPPAVRTRKFKSPLKNSLYETMTRTLLPALLRVCDRNSMAFSREVRLPFLDHRLVEFLFAVPNDQKIRKSSTKVILRNAIRNLVPEETRLRKDKLGYAPPEDNWLRGPLRPWIQELFESRRFLEREWFDQQSIRHAWKEFISGRDGLTSAFWRWISLEIWAEVFLENGWRRFLKPCSIRRTVIPAGSEIQR